MQRESSLVVSSFRKQLHEYAQLIHRRQVCIILRFARVWNILLNSDQEEVD